MVCLPRSDHTPSLKYDTVLYLYEKDLSIRNTILECGYVVVSLTKVANSWRFSNVFYSCLSPLIYKNNNNLLGTLKMDTFVLVLCHLLSSIKLHALVQLLLSYILTMIAVEILNIKYCVVHIPPVLPVFGSVGTEGADITGAQHLNKLGVKIFILEVTPQPIEGVMEMASKRGDGKPYHWHVPQYIWPTIVMNMKYIAEGELFGMICKFKSNSISLYLYPIHVYILYNFLF